MLLLASFLKAFRRSVQPRHSALASLPLPLPSLPSTPWATSPTQLHYNLHAFFPFADALSTQLHYFSAVLHIPWLTFPLPTVISIHRRPPRCTISVSSLIFSLTISSHYFYSLTLTRTPSSCTISPRCGASLG